MSARTTIRLTACITLFTLMLTGCFRPPFNDFRKDNHTIRRVAISTGVGAGGGALVGALAGNAGAGAVIGGVAGAVIGYYKSDKRALVQEMEQLQDMQFIEYGDTITVIIPTDRYYRFNSQRLNDICYPGLINVVKLLQYYPDSPVYVAAFTDEVGTREHRKRLTQARAETMLTFLWANDIKAQQLHAEGYGSEHAIGDNRWIRGSAYNRRIEIQWFKHPMPLPESAVSSAAGVMK